MSTVASPVTMESTAQAQMALSPMRAAGRPPMITFTAQGGMMGPPTWGAGPGQTAGQTWLSPIREAGLPPMITVGSPVTTLPPWAHESVILAEGLPISLSSPACP